MQSTANLREFPAELNIHFPGMQGFDIPTVLGFPDNPVIIAWLVMLAWLAFHTGAGEVQWARLLAVLGSLEAVAFAAAGALFDPGYLAEQLCDTY